MYIFHHNVYYTQPYKYGNFTVTFNTVVAHLGKNPHAEINFALAYSDNSRLKFIASLFTDKARIAMLLTVLRAVCARRDSLVNGQIVATKI